MKPHTPTPWTAEISNQHPTGRIIRGSTVVAYGTSRTDTRFIVHTCNNHADLLLAAHELLRVLELCDAFLQGLADNEWLETMKQSGARRAFGRNAAAVARLRAALLPAELDQENQP